MIKASVRRTLNCPTNETTNDCIDCHSPTAKHTSSSVEFSKNAESFENLMYKDSFTPRFYSRFYKFYKFGVTWLMRGG